MLRLSLVGLAIMSSVAIQQARAQDAIGGAEVVEREVRGSLGSSIRTVKEGDKVFQDELISTSSDSLAKLELVDLSKLSIGPSSQLKLDKFVYSRPGSSGTIVLNAAKGAFRFATGSADHRSYQVVTPTATIGVRGTTYDVLVAPGKTIAVLKEGEIRVCRRVPKAKLKPSDCVVVNQPGTGTIVTLTGISPPANVAWSFDAVQTGFVTGAVTTTRTYGGGGPQNGSKN